MTLLRGKQIEGITQGKMDIQTITISETNSITNKEYTDGKINELIKLIHQSNNNQNMVCNVAVAGQKACNDVVADKPLSNIMVKLNGVMVNAGNGLDCYFSPDGIIIREGGLGQEGDFLYWNAEYSLDAADEIDFIYLTSDTLVEVFFNIGSGFDMPSTNITRDINGKYLILGYFTQYQVSNTSQFIVRLNQDGSIDTTFSGGSGFNNHWQSFSHIQDSNGKYLIGGNFTTYQDQTANMIVRLNQDGSIDTTFNSGVGFDDTICSIIQDDDKYVIGGNFTTYQDQTVNRIIRLNQDGSIDTTFNSGIGFNSTVYSIIQDDDKYVVGGWFSTYYTYDLECNYIIRLNHDGTVDTTFNSGSGFNNNVNSIIKDGNQYLIGGDFTTYQGQTTNHIISLNQDGSIDYTFNYISGFDDSVLSIIRDKDKYLMVGYFTTYQGQITNGIIRLNQDGSIDTNFNSGTGFDGTALSIIQDGDKYVIVGYFTMYNNILSKFIIRLNQDGSSNTISL